MDIVWLNIITELRRFGYPLDKIKDVKESLKYNSDSDKKREYPALEVCIAAAMNLNIPCFLLVFENGEALAVKYEEYKRSISFETIGNHIQINLNNILKKLYPNKKISPDFGISVRLSSEEADLLLMIRKGDFIEIKVKKRNGKIERLEATEMVKTDKRITEILKEGDYQNIEIKQQDGKISCIKRTIKKKL
jgi:DNA-binding transcriptional MerR regulator